MLGQRVQWEHLFRLYRETGLKLPQTAYVEGNMLAACQAEWSSQSHSCEVRLLTG